MLVDSEFAELIGSIYDCTLNPALWTPTLGQICTVMQGHLADLTAFDAADGSISLFIPYNWDDDLFALVKQYASLNPMLPLSLVLPLNEPFCGSRDMDLSAMHNSLYFQKCRLRERGHFDAIAVPMERSVTRVSYWAVYNRDESGPFKDEHIAFARAITPHIRRAVRISGMLDQGRVARGTLRGVLAAIPAAALIFGANSEILFANPAAEAEFSSRRLIAEREGKLRTLSPDVSNFVHSLLAGANGLDVLAKDSSGRQLHVTGVRLNLDEPVETYLLILRSPEPELNTPISAAARIYGLTISEVQVLKLLVEGQSLEQAAAVLGIARSTVKTHLDALYAKCGVNNRARLTAKIAGLISPVV